MTDTLGDLLSRDPNRIWRASWEVINTRDTALLETLRTALPTIRQATANVELGGMIQPNRDALTHALGKVQNYRTWRCWCDDYPKLLAYDPAREEERGHAKLLSRDDSGWPVTYECECVVCGRQFSVEEGEYHALWWRWKPHGPRAAGRRDEPGTGDRVTVAPTPPED